MESFNESPIRELSVQEKLAAYFRGIQKLNENKPENVNDAIVEFVDELRKTHSQEELESSESYHMLIGSTLRAKAAASDPLFSEIEKFTKETLRRL